MSSWNHKCISNHKYSTKKNVAAGSTITEKQVTLRNKKAIVIKGIKIILTHTDEMLFRIKAIVMKSIKITH